MKQQPGPGRRRLAAVVMALLAATGLGVAGPGQGASAVGVAARAERSAGLPGGGRVETVVPTRILDTRTGTGAPKQAVPAHGSVTFPITGVGSVPADGVGAVVMNLVVTDARAAGYVVAYPAGAARPATSTLNFTTGSTLAHEAVVQPGTGGRATVYNGSDATVQLVADVSGYVTAGAPTDGGEVGVLRPARVLDTRTGVGAPKAAVTNGSRLPFVVRGAGGVPSSGVSAVLLNLTVTRPTAAGYLVAAAQLTSAVNFPAGATLSNFVVLPLDADGRVSVTPRLSGPRSGSVELVADVVGYVRAGDPTAAGEVQPFAPGRLLDTRVAGRHAVPAHGSITLAVAGTAGIPSSNVTAAALDITVVAPAAAGYVVAYPAGADPPTASTVNFARTTLAAETIVPVASNGTVVLANGSSAPLNLVVDASAFVAPIINPVSWSARAQLTRGTPGPRGGVDHYGALSCPTATYCLAVDSGGDARDTVTFDGSTWSAPKPGLPDDATALSCASPSSCFALVGQPTGDGGTGTYVVRRTGTTWARITGIGGGSEELDALSCVSVSFCAVTGFDLDDNPAGGPSVWTWNGSMWRRFDLPPVLREAQVSCVSSRFCVAVDGGDAAVWNGTTWAVSAGVFPGTGSGVTVTCASAGYCLAVVGNESRSFDGTAWSTPHLLPAGYVVGRPACPAPGSCLVPVTIGSTGSSPEPGSVDGALAAVQGDDWGAPVAVDPVADPIQYAGGLTGLQCPTSGTCVLLDGYGGSQHTV